MMSFVLVLKTTAEIEESKLIMRISLEVDADNLCCNRCVPLAAAIMQYAVTMLIVYAGCAAVLSFQQTPDIVYSGLAVCFLPCMVMFYIVGRAFVTGNTPIRILHRNGILP